MGFSAVNSMFKDFKIFGKVCFVSAFGLFGEVFFIKLLYVTLESGLWLEFNVFKVLLWSPARSL